MDLSSYSLTTPVQQAFGKVLADAVRSGLVDSTQAEGVLSSYLRDGYVSDSQLSHLPSLLRKHLLNPDLASRFHVGALWRKAHPRVMEVAPTISFPPELNTKPSWVSLSGFTQVEVTPYEDLARHLKRNAELLEDYTGSVVVDSPLFERLSLFYSLHQTNLSEALEIFAYPDEAYLKNLADRTLMLQNRILDLGREIGKELELKETGALGDIIERPMVPPKIRRDKLPPATTEEEILKRVYPDLMNRSYPGLLLKLRPYQMEALRSFEAELLRVKHAKRRDPLDQEGTLLMPTGSGKTRLMSGAMGVLIKKGLMGEGDKILVTTHLKMITQQNLDKIEEDLGPDFRGHFKREIRLSVVAGKVKDFSGDVVVVSIPTVGRSDFGFEEKLRKALGDKKIPLLVMDEVHHDEAESWQKVKKAVQEVNPETYILGLTATPAGDEPNILYKKQSLELMTLGVLPRVHLAEVSTGIHLTGLKTSGGDFAVKDLEDRVNQKTRNQRAMLALEAFGRRGVTNPKQLAPTMITAVDRRHALDLGKSYVEHFGRKNSQVRFVERGQVQKVVVEETPEKPKLWSRRILLVGVEEKGGKIQSQGRQEIQAVLEKKRKEEIDGIVVVLTGDMEDRARALVYKAWEEGEIESVISAKVLAEGFDGYFVRNLVGARPTLSAVAKTQEGGRITRWGSKEVNTKKGKILTYEPRVVVDLRDIYSGNLRSYREGYGYTRKLPPKDVLWDIVGDGAVGHVKAHPAVYPGTPRNGEEIEEIGEVEVVWHQILGQLKEILARVYQGDEAELAFDLGLDQEELEKILTGEVPFRGHINLVRRLATLLYLDRDAFVQSYLADILQTVGDKQTKTHAMEALLWGLEVYLRAENLPLNTSPVFNVDTGVKTVKIKVKSFTLSRLYKKQWLPRTYPDLAQGLVEYLRGSRDEIVEAMIKGMNGVHGRRLDWDKRLSALSGMRWEDFEGAAILGRSRPETIYLVGSSSNIIRPDGRIQGSLSLKDAKPAEGSGIPYVALNQENQITEDGGNNSKLLAQSLVKAKLAVPTWAHQLGMMTHLKDLQEFAKTHPDFLVQLTREVFPDEIPSIFYLVGSNMSTLLPDGRINGSLSLKDAKPAEGNKIPYVALNPTNQIVEDVGSNSKLLVQALVKSGLATGDYALPGSMKEQWESIKNLRALEDLPKDSLTKFVREVFPNKIPSIFYLVGSGMSTLLSDGRINGSLSLVDAKPSGESRIPYVALDSENQILENRGKNSRLLAKALVKTGLATGDYALPRSMKESWEALKNLRALEKLPKDSLTMLVREVFPNKIPSIFYLVGSSASTILPDGRIQGSLSLKDAKPAEGSGIPYVALDSENQILENGGNRSQLLAQALVKAKLATGDYALPGSVRDQWETIKNLKALENLPKDSLTMLVREVFTENTLDIFYLVGSNRNTILPDGRIRGSLSLKDAKPAKGSKIPYIALNPQNQILEDRETNSKLLAQALVKAGLATDDRTNPPARSDKIGGRSVTQKPSGRSRRPDQSILRFIPKEGAGNLAFAKPIRATQTPGSRFNLLHGPLRLPGRQAGTARFHRSLVTRGIWR